MIQTQEIPVVPAADKIESGKGLFDALKGLSFDDALSSIANGIVQFSFKLLIAIFVFYIGKFIIKKIYGLVRSIMVSRNVDASLTTFVLSLIRIVLFFILIITVIGILGINTTSFLALFASAGVAIGMALSGTLQNFAGGVLILLLKPYKVGDFIEAQGFTGIVKEIQIFHTVINTPDNKYITIPNGGLSTGSINNYSKEDYRRVDWSVGLSYGDDIDKAKEVILQMLLEEEMVIRLEDSKDNEKESGNDESENLKYNTAEEANEKTQPKDSGHDARMQDEVQLESSEGDKLSWWKRIRMRRKRHQDVIQAKLKEQLAARASTDTKRLESPFVGLNQLGDSAIVLSVKAWTRSSNYWKLYFLMNERFYKELPRKGFSFPFPQMDVHMIPPK